MTHPLIGRAYNFLLVTQDNKCNNTITCRPTDSPHRMRRAVRPHEAVQAKGPVVGLVSKVASVSPVGNPAGGGGVQALIHPVPDEPPLQPVHAAEGVPAGGNSKQEPRINIIRHRGSNRWDRLRSRAIFLQAKRGTHFSSNSLDLVRLSQLDVGAASGSSVCRARGHPAIIQMRVHGLRSREIL